MTKLGDLFTEAGNILDKMGSGIPSETESSVLYQQLSNIFYQLGLNILPGQVIPTEAVLVSGVTIEPDQTINVTLTANRVIGAPLNPVTGQKLIFILQQDAVGGWTVGWNAIFKQAWSDVGNVALKRSTILFEFGGAFWNQVGAQSPYL